MFNLFVSLDCFGFQKIIRGVLLAVVVAFAISLPLFAQWPGPDDTVYVVRWTQNIYKLQLSKDDSKILTVGDEGIIIYDTQTGTQLQRLDDQDGEYSKDGTLIIGIRQNRDSTNKILSYTINTYNAESYELIKSIILPRLAWAAYVSIRLSPDGSTIALSAQAEFSFGSSLYIIDYQTGVIVKSMNRFGDEPREAQIGDFLFSNDGQYIILSYTIDLGRGKYGDGLMYINTHTYQMDYRNNNIGGDLEISDDGSMLATGTNAPGKAVSIINTQTHEIINSIPGNVAWVTAKAFSPDGQYFILTSLDYNYKIYRISDLMIVKSFDGEVGGWSGLDITKNNEYIVAGASLALIRFLTTGLPESKEENDILYPNPASNTVDLNFDLPVTANLKFNLYEVSGKFITELKRNFYTPGMIKEHFKLGNLLPGTYFLKVGSLNFNKSFKIIIER